MTTLAATAPVNSARNNDLFATWATMFETVDRATWFRNLFYWVFSASQPISKAAYKGIASTCCINRGN